MSNLLSKPVYLYVKTHGGTGLKYFGKTVKDPYVYKGSGVHWKRHLELFGDNVLTEVLGKYYDKESLNRDALSFSYLHDISNSKEWANIIIETGLDGVPFGSKLKRNPEIEEKRLGRLREYWGNPEYRDRRCKALKDAWTPERKKKYSEYSRSTWSQEKRDAYGRKQKEKWASYTEVERESRKQKIRDSRQSNTESHNEKIRKALKEYSRTSEHQDNLDKAIRERKPARVKSVTFISEGHYEANGETILRERKNCWVVQRTGEKFRKLHCAAASIQEDHTCVYDVRGICFRKFENK